MLTVSTRAQHNAVLMLEIDLRMRLGALSALRGEPPTGLALVEATESTEATEEACSVGVATDRTDGVLGIP